MTPAKVKNSLILALLTLASAAATQAALVIYDGISPSTTGSINGQATGSGWVGGWQSQNDSAVFQVADAAPLSFGTLETSSPYMIGGGGWLGTNHFFLSGFQSGPDLAGWVSSPFSDQQVDQGTVWLSFLVRRETNSGDGWRGPSQLGFLPDLSINNPSTSSGAIFTLPAAGGNWTFRQGGADAGGTAVDTGVAATVGQTQFFVLKYEFGTTTNVHAWIFTDPNSANLGGADLAAGTADASLAFADISQVRFRNFGAYTGGVDNALSIDEIRIGTDYASVSPVPEPATIALLAGLAAAAATGIRRRRRAK